VGNMARANLVVSDELKSAFLEAGSSVRWMKCVLEEVNIVLKGSGAVEGSTEEDLEAMKEGALVDGEPCFVLFSMEPGAKRGGWVLVAFVPDSSKVRARMLYASGVEDVKGGLGHTNFKGNIHVTERGELTVAAIAGKTVRDHSDAPLTEAEMLAKEEVAQMAPPGEARANAMGMVPFEFSEEVDRKLRAFASGGTNLIEFLVEDGKTVKLGNCADDTLTNSSIETKSPRFYIVRKTDTTQNVYYVFSCPEGTKIRDRMTYSTCKATLGHHISELGIEVDKVFELGDPLEIDEIMKMHDTVDEDTGKLVQTKVSKPSRPGRGKARVMQGKK